jgi:hypothetical protein
MEDFHLRFFNCKSNPLKVGTCRNLKICAEKWTERHGKGRAPALSHTHLRDFSQRKPERRGQAAHPCSKFEGCSDQS